MRGKVKVSADAGPEAADGGAEEEETQEIDLRENPNGHLQGGPTAPVFEEWYHSKISRKEVTLGTVHHACHFVGLAYLRCSSLVQTLLSTKSYAVVIYS
jgi:hypothetical protein